MVDVRSTFKEPGTNIVTLDCGKTIEIPKWGVRKMLRLGDSFSTIIAEAYRHLSAAEGEPGEKTDVEALVMAFPRILETSMNALAELIESGTTLRGGKPQLTRGQILGEDDDDPNALTIDDFISLLIGMIEYNFSERTLGKLKGALSRA